MHPSRSLAALVALAGLPAATLAQNGTFTWSGGMGRWLDAAKWNEQGGPPSSSTHTGVVGGLLGADATIDGWVTVRAVEVQSGLLPVRVSVAGGATLRPELITNDARLSVNLGSSSAASIRFRGQTPALGGFGVTELNAGASPATALITNDGDRSTELLVRPGHTISGKGQIEIKLNNQGTILSDRLWEELAVANYPVTNSGLFRAANTSRLRLSNFTMTQIPTPVGGGRLVADGAEINLDAVTVTGGSMHALNGGTFVSSRSLFDSVEVELNGCTWELINTTTTTLRNIPRVGGSIRVPNATLSIDTPTFNNTHQILLQPSGTTAAALAVRAPSLTLTGVGTLELSAVSNAQLNTASVYAISPSATLINESTIAGTGLVSLPYANRGLITSNRPGQTLSLVGAGTNEWRLTATAGGRLKIAGTLTQTPAGAVLGQDGTLDLSNLTITGGRVALTAATGSVVFENTSIRNAEVDFEGVPVTLATGNLRLENVQRINAPVTVTSSRSLTIASSNFVNGHRITLDPAAATASLSVDQPSVLTGAGVLDLRSAPGAFNAFVNASNGSTLTLGPDQSLIGRGALNAGLINRGLISPGREEPLADRTDDLQIGGYASVRCDPTSRVHIHVAGKNPGDFDRFTVGAPAAGPTSFTCGGTLVVESIDGFPGLLPGEFIEIVRAGNVYGAFDAVELPAGPRRYGIQYGFNFVRVVGLLPACYANCDESTTLPALNALDFSCFLARYQQALALPAAQQTAAYANCDGSTTTPILNALDFSCFLNRYRTGCN